MSGCYGNCSNELDRANLAILVLLLGNLLQYEVKFSELL